MTRLLIVGAGGFGREMYQAVLASLRFRADWDITSIGYLDDASAPPLLRAPLVGTVAGYDYTSGDLGLCAIGSPQVRRQVVGSLAARGLRFPAFIDDRAHVGEGVEYGDGLIVGCGSVITVDVKIGEHTHINTYCTVGHDVVIGDFSTFSSQCNLTGGASVGSDVFFGTGATVIPGKSVGDGARVGAGSVVVRSVKTQESVFGNPARRI